jgi:TonB-dependent siderophore receptor
MNRSTIASCLGVLVLAWVLVAGSPVLAEETPAGDEQAGEQSTGDGDGEPRQSDLAEFVEVTDTYIPSSNTVASKLPIPLQETPASVGVVTAPLINEQNGLVLSDALPNVSGLNVQSGLGIFDYFLIRGYDSLSSSMVMTDGAQEPEVIYYPMYNVEGVEVLKGPSGYLYGPNPLAGVVNIVRKQPVPNNFFGFRAQYGSFDSSEASLDWNWSNQPGNYNFRLNGTYLGSDGYRDDKSSTQYAVNPSFAWRPSKDASLVANFEFLQAEYNPDAGIPLLRNEIPDVRRENSYQSPFDFSEQTLNRFQVDYQNDLSEMLTLRNKAYFRDLDWQTNGTLFNGVVPSFTNGRPEVSRTLSLLDDRQRFIGNQFEAVMRLGSGTVRHNLLTGFEAIRYTDRFTFDVAVLLDDGFNVANIDLFNPVETATQYAIIPPGQIPNNNQLPVGDTTTTTLAPYVVDQMDIGRKWGLLVGARYDAIDFEDSVNPAQSRNDGKVSPRLGVVFKQSPTLSWYLNAGESFAPPSPRVTGIRVPEESVQLELGAKKQFLGDRIRTTFAVYHLDRENIAIPDESGFTQEAGDQRSRGFEVELAAEPMPRLRTFLAYAYNDSELTRFTERVIVGLDQNFNPIFGTVDRSGNTPAFAPKNLATLWVGYNFRGGLGIAGGARYVGTQYIAEDNAFALSSYTVVDATVSYRFKTVKLFLNLRNLTDTEYEVRGFRNTSVTPATPFAAYAGLSLNL